jgi:hypothetical protein
VNESQALATISGSTSSTTDELIYMWSMRVCDDTAHADVIVFGSVSALHLAYLLFTPIVINTSNIL